MASEDESTQEREGDAGSDEDESGDEAGDADRAEDSDGAESSDEGNGGAEGEGTSRDKAAGRGELLGSAGGRGSIYRGKSGMFSFYMHRITGVAILAFLILHIADVAAMGWGRDAYNTIHKLYESLFFRFLEIGLLAALLYHALNGVRIAIIDFFEKGSDYQKQLSLAVLLAFLVLFSAGATRMMMLYYAGRGGR